MRRSIFAVSIIAVALLAPLAFIGCGSDSSTAPRDDGGTSLRPYIKNGKPGFVYRWAGVVNASGVGVAGKGPEGLTPGETHLYWPQDVSFDVAGNVYVLDWNNHRVLNLNGDGTINELIGGRFGDAKDGKADEIGLNHPTGVTFDPQGYLILSAWHNSIIKRMDLSTGIIWTICGIDDEVGNRGYNGDGIPAEDAYLDLPVNTAFDEAGNMYFGDQASMLTRMVDTNGVIHTLAGRPPEWIQADSQTAYDSLVSYYQFNLKYCIAQDRPHLKFYVRYCGYVGDGGPATEAELNTQFGQAANPAGRICLDAMENIYIADSDNHCVRRIDKVTGNISTYAGVGPGNTTYNPAHEGIPANQAPLSQPRDVECDGMGNLYIADTGHHCIRKVDANGIITTVAGLPGTAGNVGTSSLPALTDAGNNIDGARFNQPYGVAIGPDGNLWIADRSNNVIRVLILE